MLRGAIRRNFSEHGGYAFPMRLQGLRSTTTPCKNSARDEAFRDGVHAAACRARLDVEVTSSQKCSRSGVLKVPIDKFALFSPYHVLRSPSQLKVAN
eukprot:7298173-Pyramimonas_sp.AAC.1